METLEAFGNSEVLFSSVQFSFQPSYFPLQFFNGGVFHSDTAKEFEESFVLLHFAFFIGAVYRS